MFTNNELFHEHTRTAALPCTTAGRVLGPATLDLQIALDQIAPDSVDQWVERGEYVAAEARFNDLLEHFGLAQEARYPRFAAALNAARGAFRGNEAK